MKAEIVEQMRAELYETELCQNDFEKYDLKSLEQNNEPFFWLVREYGTDLCYVGASAIKNWYNTEANRFTMFQDFKAPICGLLYHRKENVCKVFYWDGLTLIPINFDDIERIYENLCKLSFDNAVATFKYEYEICNHSLEIRFGSEETEKQFKEALEFAESLGDASLNDCIERLKRWRRVAVNQYIEIYNDFTKHCFSWSEMINGKCHINGGIIYHAHKNNDHWQIHT